MLDTIHSVETPEGVRLALRAAGPIPRALAYMMDATVRGFCYFAALIVLSTVAAGLADAFLLIAFFLGEWLYPVFFEVLADGQTLGKKAVGLRVLNDDGSPIGWSASILRNLLTAADWIPGTYAAGLICSLSTDGFRRLGDLAAGTIVVHAASTDAQAVTRGDARPTPPPFPLTLEEQRAVIAFGERAAFFSEARADELAALAAPLHGADVAPRERILGIGAWLLGQRGDPTE